MSCTNRPMNASSRAWSMVAVAAMVHLLVVDGGQPSGCPSADRQYTVKPVPRRRHNTAMDTHEPDFVVVGENVALGPLRRDLSAAYARWMNQLEVRRGLASLA